jgi:hypothetical protein
MYWREKFGQVVKIKESEQTASHSNITENFRFARVYFWTYWATRAFGGHIPSMITRFTYLDV